jgi:hypothetical protein
LSRKAVHNWVEGSSVADDALPGAEVAATAVKIFLCCGVSTHL